MDFDIGVACDWWLAAVELLMGATEKETANGAMQSSSRWLPRTSSRRKFGLVATSSWHPLPRPAPIHRWHAVQG